MSQNSSPLYKLSSNHLFSEVGEEAVILELDSGVYYGLNETGVQIWQWLKEPKRFTELYQLLMDEYDVDSQQCEADLKAILQGMTEVGIIQLSDSN